MFIIKQRDKRTGTIYVYESKSYWDKEKQQPRSNRTLIGKIDGETGEIIPTGGRGKKRAEKKKPVSGGAAQCDEQKRQLKEKSLLINQLAGRNKELEEELASVIKEIRSISDRYEGRRLSRP